MTKQARISVGTSQSFSANVFYADAKKKSQILTSDNKTTKWWKYFRFLMIQLVEMLKLFGFEKCVLFFSRVQLSRRGNPMILIRWYILFEGQGIANHPLLPWCATDTGPLSLFVSCFMEILNTPHFSVYVSGIPGRIDYCIWIMENFRSSNWKKIDSKKKTFFLPCRIIWCEIWCVRRKSRFYNFVASENILSCSDFV